MDHMIKAIKVTNVEKIQPFLFKLYSYELQLVGCMNERSPRVFVSEALNHEKAFSFSKPRFYYNLLLEDPGLNMLFELYIDLSKSF